jgi:hypothetical protein
MLRRCSPLLCLLLLLIAWPAAAQDTPALRLDAQPLFGGKFRPGSWLPFRVTVANDGRDVQALISVKVDSTYEAMLDLPQGAHKSITIYTRPSAAFRPKATVRVLVGGAEAAATELPLSSVSTNTRLIGLLTAQPFTVPLPNKGGLRYEAVTLQSTDLPERGEGLSAFDALVIDGAPLGTLGPPQQQALVDWVMTGGQLLIGGDQLGATLAQLPEALRLATMGEPVADGTGGLTPTLSATIPGVALTPTAGARVIAGSEEHVMGVQRDLGKGMVTLVGFSLGAPQLVNLPPNDQFFWERVVHLPTLVPNMPPEFLNGDMRTEQLGFALTQLPTLAMPPLGVLAGLLAAYLLIIGPGLYLLLRRWDRQAWGWVAIPVATLLFSAGAYGYALGLRGNDLILNQISVVEPLGTRTFVQTLGGVFSPRTQTYTVHSDADVLFRPLGGAFMGPGVNSNASSGSHYQQAPSAVRDLSVAQWAMSSFAADQMVDGTPLEADLTLVDNMLRGEVRNTGTTAINGLALVQNTQIARIGDLQPGEQRTVEMKLDGAAPNNWGAPLSWRILRGDEPPGMQSPDANSAQINMRSSVLDAVLSSPFGTTAVLQPTLLGWMEQAPVTLSIERSRAQHQQLALLTMPVTPTYPRGERINLPRGWLNATVEASARDGGPCPTNTGMGWYASGGVITTTLQLPSGLEDLEVDTATLYGQHDGPAANDIKLSVYDWTTQTWSDVEGMRMNGGSQPLDQPARFLGPDGTFQLRTELGETQMGNFGCTSVDLSIEGTQP